MDGLTLVLVLIGTGTVSSWLLRCLDWLDGEEARR